MPRLRPTFLASLGFLLLALASLISSPRVAPTRLAVPLALRAPPTPTPVARPALCLSADEVRRRHEEFHGVLSHYRSTGVCVALEDGRYNRWLDLVCDPARFWTGTAGVLPYPANLEAGLAAAATREASAKCKAKRQVAWLRVGELSFTGNDYIDFLVWRLFFSDPWWVGRGRFVETGAQNGVYASNTLFLERFVNFSGLLIEGTPCAVCQVPFNRPGSTVLHSALAAPDSAPTLDVREFGPYCATNEAHPEGSVCGVEDCAAGAQPWAPVPAAPLTDISERAGFQAPDFLSLDVEQFGETVIRTANWTRLRPRVVVAECNSAAGDKTVCSRVLTEQGYTVVPIGAMFPHDLLAWRNDDGCSRG